MVQKTALVTGGGSGIGQALAWNLAEHGHQVWIVGRRRAALEETVARFPKLIHAVEADVAQPEGRLALQAALAAHGVTQLGFLVHNAAVLKPIQRLDEVTLEDWRYHQAVNLEAPLFLTQLLLPLLRPGGRILHIGSGAARQAYPGWGAYCVSKAALHMLYQVLDEELRETGVRVGSVRPGVVDTPMQGQIREADPAQFPGLPRFIAMKEEDRLANPTETAKFLYWILNTPDPAFSESEWDIYDTEHQAHWR